MCRWTSFVATDGWCSEVTAWDNYHFGCAFVVYYQQGVGRFAVGGAVALLADLYPIKEIEF